MRRAIVLLLSAIVLLGTVLAGGGAFVTAQETDLADHPLVGSWVVNIDPEVPENPPSLVMFSSDGTYLEIDAEGGNGLGVWEPAGDTTANVTFSFVDEAGAITMIRASVEVTPDEQSLTADYTLEFFDPSGEGSGEIGPGTAEGTRMEAEGPGTPVASIEEFFGQVEGTPEATPES